MYGEGNTSKLVEDITKSTSQISEGLTAGLGIDIKSVLAGALGTKMLMDANESKEEKIGSNIADAITEGLKGVTIENKVEEEVKTETNTKKTSKK